MEVPAQLLKMLYQRGSLANYDEGVYFAMKNKLQNANVIGINHLRVDGKSIAFKDVYLLIEDKEINPAKVSEKKPIYFALHQHIEVILEIDPLDIGKHEIEIGLNIEVLGNINLVVEDYLISDEESERVSIPRNEKDDYTNEAAIERQDFVDLYTGSQFNHLKQYSFNPSELKGNIENFIGVAQVPIGIAGPIKINGEHSQGEYIVPLAATEGTLVASYNRGIKIINLSGGAKCTLVDDSMQRAPVFVMKDARAARDFVVWVLLNEKKIAQIAEATTNYGKLSDIDWYLASKFAYLRFNYTTGDAAGQNMVGRATFAACQWINENYKDQHIVNFYLESNLATDKKASQVNVMRTRGKRVTAECTIQKEILERYMRVNVKTLLNHTHIANIGAILSGANNNGLHSANGITAMYIATGQDVANVAESSAGILHAEETTEGDLYVSITIPSLIIATHGGGTGLPTQKECLEMMGCYGKNKVGKLAEIMAGVVLAGEISLASAISSSDWVSSHEKFGRNK